MDDDGKDDKEIDARAYRAGEVVEFPVALPNVRNEVATVLDIEHRADTDRTKITHEQCLFPVADHSGHELIREQDTRDAAQEKDHEAHGEEPADGNPSALGIMEFGPRDDGADVHEPTKVEKNVDAGVDFIVASLGFHEILPIPVERVSSHCAGKKVVGSDGAACSEDEKTKSSRKENVRLAINPPPFSDQQSPV